MQKTYNVIYADPPWKHWNKRTGGGLKSGAEQKYKVVSLTDLLYLDVNKISDKDSVCFLWVTTPFLEGGIFLLRYWGFQYKTTITWRKESWGMGFWFRGQTEHLLFGIKGKIKPFRHQKANFIQTKALKHSEKPEEIRKLIEDATVSLPDRRMIELFATKIVTGWDCIGYEANGQDVFEVLGRREASRIIQYDKKKAMFVFKEVSINA